MSASAALAVPTFYARRIISQLSPSQRRTARKVKRDLHFGPILEGTTRVQRVRNGLRGTARPNGRPSIWAVSAVRNEDDILEESVVNLIEQGVDTIAIVNHLSTDSTQQVLHDLQRQYDVRFTTYTGATFYQSWIMSRLARAAALAGADWVIAFDADEIWRGTEGKSVRDVLTESTADTVHAACYQYMPGRVKPGGWYSAEWTMRERSPSDLGKVAFRANAFCHVVNGNHNVYLPRDESEWALRLAHYRFRSVDQVMTRGQTAAQAMKEVPDAFSKTVWRYTSVMTKSDAEEFVNSLATREDLVDDPPLEW